MESSPVGRISFLGGSWLFSLVTSLLLLLGVVSSEPLRPTKFFDSWFAVEQQQRPAVPYEAVQSVVDFPAGGFVARHTHGGPLYAVTLEGTLTVWIEGEPALTVHEGDSIVEPYQSISSASAAAPSSLLATYLIPVGANVTTFLEPASTSPAPPGPSSRFQLRMRLDSAPDECYKVNLYLLSYAPGARAAPEHVAAPRLSTVVSGEVKTSKRTFKAGESWIQRPGEITPASRNVGTETAVVAVSIVPVTYIVSIFIYPTLTGSEPNVFDCEVFAFDLPDCFILLKIEIKSIEFASSVLLCSSQEFRNQL